MTGPTYVDATVGGKRLRRGARLWTRGDLDLQGRDLPLPAAGAADAEEIAAGAPFPPGTVHLPDWADSEWLKQLIAEQLVTVKGKRGFAKLEWQKLRERNEALDCRVYARAAAWIVGRRPLVGGAVAGPGAAAGGETAGAGRRGASDPRAAPGAARRTVRSSYMG